VRVLIADDHRLFVEGLTDLVTAHGHRVVATAADGFEAIDRARIHRPDLVLMDLLMPRCDGLEATRAISQAQPEIRIVILTTSDAEEHLFDAIAAGAFGYLIKSMRGEELIDALADVARGVPPFAPGLAACLLAEFARRSSATGERAEVTTHDPLDETLTTRELEVLRSVATGRTYRETASLLGMSERTVRYHMSEMLARLHVARRSQVIAYAAQAGLLDTDR
jgi:DNA-binding NarL/FixJ family response regulator